VAGKSIGLGYHPRAWQRECHQKRKRFTVLALHRRAGKTELAIMELVDKALKCSLPLPQFFYVAPFLKQAKAIAWARLKHRVDPLVRHGAAEIIESELAVRFKANDATVRIFGADNPDAMRGVHLDGVVLDEVAQMKPEIWEDIVRPCLSDRKGWALFIGTPKGVDLFSSLYFKAQQDPAWQAGLYTVYDTNALDPVEVEELKRDMNESRFAREFLCDFTAAGDDQLISLADVEAAAHRLYRPGEMDYAPRILGVDPARFGDDRSVIFPRQGLVALQPEVLQGLDNMQLASRVASKISDWKPDAVFIDAGGGAGVIDRLRQLGHNVIEVNFGGKATQPGYLNKRAEMWWGVNDWLTQGGAIPNRPDLKQDLAAPKFWYDAQGRKVLEPKDEIKKRGLRSPDLGDALALTFAHQVEKAPEVILTAPARGGARKATGVSYDPYELLQ
jgi:hypothetical protein